jgi:hypothetical protein
MEQQEKKRRLTNPKTLIAILAIVLVVVLAAGITVAVAGGTCNKAGAGGRVCNTQGQCRQGSGGGGQAGCPMRQSGTGCPMNQGGPAGACPMQSGGCCD